MKFSNFGKRNELANELAVGTASEPTDSEFASHNQSKQAHMGEKSGVPSDDENVLERIPSPSVEAGVKKVEAVTLTWTKKELIAAYACIFLVFFIVSL
ncbi:hypothetical protein ONS96_002363 [Cadophora gregata f. sp. sojae]|nr:hypothetical protein ONS96_002363 [Cadophora gregata f. sp. sojae]